jgi:opacity protein-like surface antigen
MFKKLLLSTVLIVSANVAVANGPYLGLSTGVVTNTANSVNYRGMPGTVFGGYGGNLGQGVYLAGEVFSTIGKVKISDNGLKSTYDYGLSFIPGVMISDHNMGYLRIGLVRTHFVPKNVSSANVTGAQFGVGMQTGLTQNWDLRGEYIYTASKHITGVSGDPRTDSANIGMVYKFD